MVPSCHFLSDVKPLTHPFPIGGLGGSTVIATHYGLIKGFPVELGKAYWGPSFDVFLISLGYIQMCGGSYIGKGNSLQVFDTYGKLIEETTLLRNNLAPMKLLDSSSKPLLANAFVAPFYTAAQISDAELAEELHDYFHHPSDDVLIDSIDYGHVQTTITSSAVRLNRLLRGPCPHCEAGKMTNDPYPPSTNEPELSIGQTLSTDVNQLFVPTPGGNTHKSNIVDHKTGYFGVLVHKSKKASELVKGFKQHIAVDYNSHGHKVDNLTTDSEHVYGATRPDMAPYGVLMGMTAPGQHAQRVERYTRTAGEKKRATLSRLPFVLPPKYEIYLDMDVARSMNHLVNSLTNPLTPVVLVTGSKPKKHKKFPFLQFGTVCMVQKYDSKINKEAADFGISPTSTPYSELGVCMGEEKAHPGSYLFCVANGEVVPRKVFSVTHAWPWDWQRKFSPKAELFIPKVPRHTYHLQTQQRIDAVDLEPSLWHDHMNNDLPHLSMSRLPGSQSSQILPSLDSYPHSMPVASSKATTGDFDFTGHYRAPVPHAITGPVLPTISFVDAVSPPVSPARVPSATPPVVLGSPAMGALVLPRLQPPDAVSSPVSPARVQSATPPVVLGSPVGALVMPRLQSHVSPTGTVIMPVSSPPVIPVNASVIPTLPVFTAPRRSGRLLTAKPAVPGAHRSYLSTSTTDHIKAAQWTQVGKSKKSSKSIPAVVVTDTDDNESFTIPTEQAGELTITDAISYLSKCTFTRSIPSCKSQAYAAVDRLKPQPSTKCTEKTLKQALKPSFAVAAPLVNAAVIKHLDMLTTDLGTISLLSPDDIQTDCVRVYGQILIKLKHDDRITARLAAGGNRQPLSSHGETFAPTASESSSNLLLAAYQAFGKEASIPIHFNTFDLSNAFQNTLLDKENYPRQIIMLMPDNLPGKYASFSNQWVEVHKAINGLRQSNELFDRDIRHQMKLAGFTETCDPCVYHKQDPTNPLAKCTINMHVDDGASLDSSDKLYQDAVTQLTLRWGALKLQSGPNIVYNGKNIITHSNGAIAISMDSYISRACAELGVAHLPPIGAPSNADFFKDSTDTTPADKLLYSKFNGCLTHVVTKGRFELKKESHFLSKFLSCPNEGHMSKMIEVWQYLNCTPTLGPVYDTDEGVNLVLHVDSAFGVHMNGTSHTGAYLSIGRFNAPIWVMSKPQDNVALSPQASEYYGLSDPCQDLLWHRQILHDIGFPQQRTIVFEDNIPSINLAYSPQITRKSRYMHVRHHFVRELVKNKTIKICHVDSKIQAADLLTHPMKPAPFKRHRYRFFNLQALPCSV